MRRAGVVPAWLVALAVTGCGSTDPHPPASEEEHPHGATEHEEHEGEEGILRVHPSMLRDLRLTTLRIEPRSGAETVTLLGEATVDEDRYGEVGTPVAARVVTLVAAPGARVERGDPLVELESVELGRTRAAVSGVRARVTLAETTLARRRGLVAEGLAPTRELSEAEAELAAARSELQALRTTERSLAAGRGRGGGSRLVLRAPIGGVVLERAAVLGRMAEPQDVLYRIGDLRRLWVVVHAFERDAVRVRRGARARLSFAALPGRSFDGTVTWLGSRVDPASRTLPVRVEVDNERDELRPGMSATAILPVGDDAARVLAVPAAALQRTADGWVVFLPRARGTFEVRPVGRGRDLGEDVEIVGGLQAGETVVVEGAFLLKSEIERSQGGGEEAHEH